MIEHSLGRTFQRLVRYLCEQGIYRMAVRLRINNPKHLVNLIRPGSVLSRTPKCATQQVLNRIPSADFIKKMNQKT